MIAAKLGKVDIKIIGDKPSNLSNWLWDFDAEEIDPSELGHIEEYKRISKRGLFYLFVCTLQCDLTLMDQFLLHQSPITNCLNY